MDVSLRCTTILSPLVVASASIRCSTPRERINRPRSAPRQISTRELDPHVFPDEVDWTTRHAFSGAYDLPRRGCGLEKLLGHMNRSREGRVVEKVGSGPRWSPDFFREPSRAPLRDVFTGGVSNVLATLGALATYLP